MVSYLLALTSQQYASISQGRRISSDDCKCCNTEIEAADRCQTCSLTQSQYTDTRGRHHGGRRPSNDDSFHSPTTVIPPSALDKPRRPNCFGGRDGVRTRVFASSPPLVQLPCEYHHDQSRTQVIGPLLWSSMFSRAHPPCLFYMIKSLHPIIDIFVKWNWTPVEIQTANTSKKVHQKWCGRQKVIKWPFVRACVKELVLFSFSDLHKSMLLYTWACVVTWCRLSQPEVLYN